jgi:hypothetical protein
MAHSVVCLPSSHLAAEDGRHYATLSVCLRRHLLSLGQLFALASLRPEFYGVLFGRASEFDLWSNGD